MRYLADTEALQSFIAVAEELNFRRAAERLNLDQSALSRRIQRLEAQVGFDLFARSTRAVQLTEAGHAFYEDNLQTLTQLERAVLRAKRVAEGKVGHVRIGYMAFAATQVMPRAIRSFLTDHPEMDVEIIYTRTMGQKLALARNEIDVGFMIGPFSHDDFATLKVSAERLIAILPVPHPLASEPRLTLRDLAASDMVLGDLTEWEAFRQILAELFATRGLTLRPTLEASSTLGILGLVAAGLGVSLYPDGLRRFQPQHVAIRQIDDCELRIETVLAWRKDRAKEGAISQFLQCCAREFGGP